MRALAEFIMRGPKQAALFATLTAIAPLTSWLSAAALSLVVLRQGLTKATWVIIWPLLLALYFATQGYHFLLGLLVGTLVLALVLRNSVSWVKTLSVSVLVGAAVVLCSLWLLSEQLNVVEQQFKALVTSSPVIEQAVKEQFGSLEKFERALPHLIVGAWAFIVTFLCVTALILARWWQSVLYVPGGFSKEFHSLKLPAWLSGCLLVLSYVGPEINTDLLRFMLITSFPLFIAGVALVHGIVAKKQMSKQWLILFYLIQLLFMHFMYPLLVIMAFLDSLLNFRGRLQQKPPV
ncbi:DUF2232 domain-containing protein [Zooshikella marina]|uniref:DUF2232 domain-containing protein n=1 Tax=Zooshikella ganghwensis TaxID=202772 RepID=UPI001BAEA410|nr:DUF2232 domain-containing protein [Zooshikella ganghwensis]MBU2706186.1 DUF2232 domain-containing protein [Zooshikella ganghwensis]